MARWPWHDCSSFLTDWLSCWLLSRSHLLCALGCFEDSTSQVWGESQELQMRGGKSRRPSKYYCAKPSQDHRIISRKNDETCDAAQPTRLSLKTWWRYIWRKVWSVEQSSEWMMKIGTWPFIKSCLNMPGSNLISVPGNAVALIAEWAQLLSR